MQQQKELHLIINISAPNNRKANEENVERRRSVVPPVFSSRSLTSLPSRALANNWAQIASTSIPADLVRVINLSAEMSRPSSARMRAA